MERWEAVFQRVARHGEGVAWTLDESSDLLHSAVEVWEEAEPGALRRMMREALRLGDADLRGGAVMVPLVDGYLEGKGNGRGRGKAADAALLDLLLRGMRVLRQGCGELGSISAGQAMQKRLVEAALPKAGGLGLMAIIAYNQGLNEEAVGSWERLLRL